MKIKETKVLQHQRLKEICNEKDVNFDSIEILLESVKTKKLLKRNNYYQQKINDVIEKAIK
ncbi:MULTISPECIES: DNA modification system-associated small protein [Tenacibaculum]|uniref:DNA modification system-associated small protein n=1 Tax=Tenacibaculum TaxID=104267 RepID=UPI00293E3AED|nr:DNA modification system-associated small protein [Tenacibaculum piscium]